MSKLVFRYYADHKDHPINDLERIIQGWDDLTASQPNRVLTIRFNGPSVIRCIGCLCAEGKIKCNVEIWSDEKTQVELDRKTGRITPWFFKDHDLDWAGRAMRASVQEPEKVLEPEPVKKKRPYNKKVKLF